MSLDFNNMETATEYYFYGLKDESRKSGAVVRFGLATEKDSIADRDNLSLDDAKLSLFDGQMTLYTNYILLDFNSMSRDTFSEGIPRMIIQLRHYFSETELKGKEIRAHISDKFGPYQGDPNILYTRIHCLEFKL